MRLSKREARWIQDIFEGFAPPAAEGAPARGLQPRPSEVDYPAAFVKLNRRATPLAQGALRSTIWMVALAPIWLWGRKGDVSSLSMEERETLLLALLEHPLAGIREMTWILKVQTSMGLLGTPSVRERSHYDRDRGEGVPPLLRIGKKDKKDRDHDQSAQRGDLSGEWIREAEEGGA